MFIQNRDEARQFFLKVWQKRLAYAVTEPLEALVAEVIEQHPEYHALLQDDRSVVGDYTPEAGVTNPFLHMGMHIALREQLAADRPQGIKVLYARLLLKYRNAHVLEHAMAECLGEALWQAQRNNTLPDEAAYLECLRKL